MTTISPSILSCDFLNIEQDIRAFNDAKNIWFHLDIMDGHFVPNMTFGPPILKNLHTITNHPLDAHLMVNNPEFYVENLKEHNLLNLTFHLEAIERSKVLPLIKRVKELYQSAGISIRPNTKVEELTTEILNEIDLVLIMSVEPGFGGQSFMENALEKIAYLKKYKKDNNLNFVIQVDGGINESTGAKCIKSGADNLVAGSYIFKADQSEYLNKIESLRE